MLTARASQSTSARNRTASSGWVYSPLTLLMPSSVPPMVPISASTDTPRSWANSRTRLDLATFSLNGSAEPSNMTEEYPASMASRISVRLVQWSRCSTTSTISSCAMDLQTATKLRMPT